MGVDAHTVLTYPGWRGDNLVTNDTFPYGMQWMYPCEYFFCLCWKGLGEATARKRADMDGQGKELNCPACKFKQDNSIVELCFSCSSAWKSGNCSLTFTSSPLTEALFSQPLHLITINSANTSRRRHAHNHKPHPLAHNRRRHRPTTRLVPRPRNRLLLHEHGLRHKRTRQRTTKHVLPHGARLPNCRSLQEPISRHNLPASSTTTERNPDTERGRQCDDSSGGDGRAWCCVVFCKSSISPRK